MKAFPKIPKIFSAMPRGEQVFVTALLAIFLLSSGHWLVTKIWRNIPAGSGMFAEGIIGNFHNVNPLFVDFNEADRDLSMLVFSGLMRYDPRDKNFVPDLAEKWDRSSDGRTYTLVMRQNALWHDGTPVTPDDVLFTFHQVVQDPEFRNPFLRSAFEGVEMKKTDDHTVTFTLPRANSFFISQLTTGLLPKHILGNTPPSSMEKSSFGQRPIGTGPYRLTKLSLGSNGDYADLQAFPQYYGEKPLVSKLRLLTFADEESLTKASGSLHALDKLSSQGKNAEKVAGEGRFTAYPYILNQFSALFLNTDNAFLKERNVRQALRTGLDKNLLVPQGERRVDALDLADHSKEASFTFNLEQANKVLDDMGLKRGADGVRVNHKGERMELRILVSTRMPTKMSEEIQEQWAKLGANLIIDAKDGGAFFTTMSERRYDVLLIRQNLGYNRDVYALFHSSQLSSPDGDHIGLNYAQFRSFRTDGLTEALRIEKDPHDKDKLFKELIEATTDETPAIFLSTPVYLYAIDKRAGALPAFDRLPYHSDRLTLLPYISIPPL